MYVNVANIGVSDCNEMFEKKFKLVDDEVFIAQAARLNLN